MINVQKDKNTAYNTDGKAKDINQGISLVPANISKRDFQIILKHKNLHGSSDCRLPQ
jgi:hypothetical protein